MRAVSAVAAVLLLAAPAIAQEEEYGRSGFFLGAGANYSVELFENDLDSSLPAQLVALGYVGDVDLGRGTPGLNGRLGYRFHPRVALEAQAEWLYQFEGKVSRFDVGTGTRIKIASIDVQPLTVTGNAKGYLLTGPLQPYVLAGVGVMTANVTVKDAIPLGIKETERDTGVAGRFGGGLDIYTSEHIVLNLGVDYVMGFQEVDYLEYLSIVWGVQYRF